MKDQLALFPEQQISNSFNKEARVVLHLGDSANFLKTIPEKQVTLIITSPPYNLGKEYEKKTSIEDYLLRQQSVINELVRVLKDDGSICWQVGNYVDNAEVFPLDIFYYNIFKKQGLRLRNRIIWHFGHGLHASKRFSGRYETILWFTKSGNYVFNLDSVRIPSKYPGKRHYKGPQKGALSGNPLGKNPSDVWELINQEWEDSFWNIPNVKANHPEKTTHPCQFPIELVERCVLALTNDDDVILDPFCGVGSALLAGLIHNRKVIGCDKDNSYIHIARERIQEYYLGVLKTRPLGTQIYIPTGREKVSRMPNEWLIHEKRTNK
jgi:adenine-specific DNA-methyltransferase